MPSADVRVCENLARVLICGLPRVGKSCAVLTALPAAAGKTTSERSALDMEKA